MWEGKIIYKECELMLDTFQSNKAPMNDGITGEFYKKFWYLISDSFVKCPNEIFNKRKK